MNRRRAIASSPVKSEMGAILNSCVGWYSFEGRSNTDADRNIVYDKSGKGNDMQLFNMSWGYTTGYEIIKEGYFNDRLYFRSTNFSGNSYGKITLQSPLQEVTVIMKRYGTYGVNDQVMGNGTASLGSGETIDSNIFSLERYASSNSSITNAVQGLSVVGRESSQIVWMNSTHYCGKKLTGTPTDKTHDGVIWLNRDRGDVAKLGRGAQIYCFFIFDRSLTPDEILLFINTYVDASYVLPSIE
jgi:hypothetical protein